MRSKFVFPVLVVASLFGAAPLASAQTEPAARAPAASGATTSNAMASMSPHRMHHHSMGYSRRDMARSRPGGMPVSRKPAD
jgi:hypothetical protein